MMPASTILGPPTMHQRRPARTALVGVLALVLALGVGALVAGRPAAAAGNTSFTNVTVTTTDSSATISFDSSAFTSVYVTIGTGLDPTTSTVAQVVLPVSATHHYTTTIYNLKPSTGYSFRLWSAYMYTYTDITMLVTKAASFHNVFASVQYVKSTIDFDYYGKGPVTVTISKTLDFTTNYYMRKTLSAPSSGTHWWTSFSDMDAGTAYAFQISAAGSPSYTDITSIVTKHRDVTLTYTSFYAIDDGDGWPYGCGDFALTHRDMAMGFNSNYFQTMDVGLCVNSGSWLDLTQFTMGKRTFVDIKGSTLRTEFYAWDDDRKVGDPECFPDFISNLCGDSAYGHTNADISTPGTHTFSVHAYGIQNSLDVIAYGKVVVTFY